MNGNSQHTIKLQELLRTAESDVSVEDIHRIVQETVRNPDATASSLVQSLAGVISPGGRDPLLTTGVPGAHESNPVSAIIDLLVKDGVLRFEGRRPVLVANQATPSPEGPE